MTVWGRCAVTQLFKYLCHTLTPAAFLHHLVRSEELDMLMTDYFHSKGRVTFGRLFLNLARSCDRQSEPEEIHHFSHFKFGDVAQLHEAYEGYVWLFVIITF